MIKAGWRMAKVDRTPLLNPGARPLQENNIPKNSA